MPGVPRHCRGNHCRTCLDAALPYRWEEVNRLDIRRADSLCDVAKKSLSCLDHPCSALATEARRRERRASKFTNTGFCPVLVFVKKIRNWPWLGGSDAESSSMPPCLRASVAKKQLCRD